MEDPKLEDSVFSGFDKKNKKDKSKKKHPKKPRALKCEKGTHSKYYIKFINILIN